MKLSLLALLSLSLVACSHTTKTSEPGYKVIKRTTAAAEDEERFVKITVSGEGDDAGLLTSAGLSGIVDGPAQSVWIAKKTDKCAAELGQYRVGSYNEATFVIDYYLEMTGVCLPLSFPEGKTAARLMAVDEDQSSVILVSGAEGKLGQDWLGAGNVDLIILGRGDMGGDWALRSHITAKQIRDTQGTSNDCEQGVRDAWFAPKQNKILLSYGERITVMTIKEGQVTQKTLTGTRRSAAANGEIFACAAMAYGFGRNLRSRGSVLQSNDGSLVLVNLEHPSKSRKVSNY